MGECQTVEHILDAAEVLFAERGFAETSLRSITSRAGVNLAAVSYHFGSKKALIQSVFNRFLDPFCVHLNLELEKIQQSGAELTLESLLELFFKQALMVKPRRGQDLSLFMRLLGLAFSQHQGHLRRHLEARHGDTFQKFLVLMQLSAPNIGPLEFFWRINFVLGASIFTMSSIRALREISSSAFGMQLHINDIEKMMIPFLSSGLRAEPMPVSVLSKKLPEKMAPFSLKSTVPTDKKNSSRLS